MELVMTHKGATETVFGIPLMVKPSIPDNVALLLSEAMSAAMHGVRDLPASAGPMWGYRLFFDEAGNFTSTPITMADVYPRDGDPQ